MSTDTKCFFCGNMCPECVPPSPPFAARYKCKYCGHYILDEELAAFGRTIHLQDESVRFKIACVLNEKRLKGLGGVVLREKTDKRDKVLGLPQIAVTDLLDKFPKKAGDFLNRTLLNLDRLHTRPFEKITLTLAGTGDRLHLFTEDQEECYALLRELAANSFIRFNKVKAGEQVNAFFLTSRFWEMVENLKRSEVDNKRAFVAMYFDKSMNKYYQDGIQKAIEHAGYEPIRIDLRDFNGKICDEIVAEIKRTKFMVADFSGLRSGVFFEAGFAKGLGREVIFIVRKADVAKLKKHFDTRQYNHIVYDSPEDLRKRLRNRIRATIV